MSAWPVVAVFVVWSPVVAVALASLLRRAQADGLISALGAVGSIVLLVRVSAVGSVHVFGNWFVVDRAAAAWTVFGLVVVLAVRTFARRLLAGDPQRERFHVTSAIAATTGAALFSAGNLVVLVVVAAASSVASAALVGSRRDGVPVARRMAAVLLAGDALLLAAVVIIALKTSSTEASALGRLDGVGAHVAAVLVVFASLARCAQVPFHGWLPRTLVAPTPASALLHAGLVNAGGVILIRFAPLVTRSVWATILGVSFATFGMVLGAAVMRSRSEVKSALVWSTTAQMGFMLVQVLVGMGPAGAVHLIAHGAYKSNLFLWSGSSIEHEPSSHAARRPVDHVAAFVAAAVVVAGAVAIVGYDLAGFGGAALLIPAFAVLTLHSILVARVGLPGRAARATVGLLVALVVATCAYLGLISVFKRWLDLPEAVPAGAWAMAVAVVAVAMVGGAVVSGSRFVPSRLALPIRAWVVATARRPMLQAVAPSPRVDRADRSSAGRHRWVGQLEGAS